MDLTRFSHLPGIDTYNADVYESGDLPEDDQNDRYFRAGADTSEAIERINISFADAHSLAKSEDASKDNNKKEDMFHNRVLSFGYFARSEYEIISERHLETPAQKFERLKSEVNEFVEMMEKVSGGKEGEGECPPPNAVEMRESAKMMLQQLQEVHLDKVAKCEETVLDPEGNLAKKISNEIAQLNAKAAVSEDTKKKPDEAGSRATYQVYVPTGASAKSSSLAELEKRVAGLEKSVGSTTDADIATLGSKPNIVSAVEKLEEKVSLIDKQNLDLLEFRLQSLLDKLKEIKGKGSGVPSEKLAKVGEMLELARKWDSVADNLPSIVDRLTVLDPLHQQTLQFSQALSSIDTLQQQISGSTKSNAASLEQLKSNMSQNMENIQSNIAALEQRINSLNKQ